MSQADAENVVRMIELMPSYDAVLQSLQQQDYHPDVVQLGAIRVALWKKLVQDQDAAARARFDQGECSYGEGKTGYFSLKIKGERPENGYPLYIGLHGGGGGPKEMNDQQWDQMKSYYLNSIESGIYVAPRGPNNTWNLHFDADAQAFYNQLLKDLRLFADIDLNRIYLLGYSAGGDGVYQLAPRLAPQLAAANMSAGHHNHISPDNLNNLPLLLQVGELDHAYNRNIETVRYSLLLDSLEKQFPGEFPHQVYVHADARHSYVRDRQGPDHQAAIISNPKTWLTDPAKKSTTLAITDAPTWLSKFWRNPFPAHIRWDTKTVLENNIGWYWIFSFQETPQYSPDRPVAEVRMFPNQNRIEVLQFQGVLQLHLHEHFIDLQMPLVVVVEGQEYEIALQPSVFDMAIHLKLRTDPAYSFWQTVEIRRGGTGKIWVE